MHGHDAVIVARRRSFFNHGNDCIQAVCWQCAFSDQRSHCRFQLKPVHANRCEIRDDCCHGQVARACSRYCDSCRTSVRAADSTRSIFTASVGLLRRSLHPRRTALLRPVRRLRYDCESPHATLPRLPDLPARRATRAAAPPVGFCLVSREPCHVQQALIHGQPSFTSSRVVDSKQPAATAGPWNTQSG